MAQVLQPPTQRVLIAGKRATLTLLYRNKPVSKPLTFKIPKSYASERELLAVLTSAVKQLPRGYEVLVEPQRRAGQ